MKDPETRAIIHEVPKVPLQRHRHQAILDEIQRALQLPSYILGIVDEDRTHGQFVLTGLHHLELREAVAQSLAGRTGMLLLLSFFIRTHESGNQLRTI